MTFLQLQDLVRRFGPIVDKWPTAMIEPALDLMRTSRAAQDFFASATAADDDGDPAAGWRDRDERTEFISG